MCRVAAHLACAALAAAAAPASAHVKWFSREADCAMPPLSPLQVVTAAPFVTLMLVSLVAMALVSVIDQHMSRRESAAYRFVEQVDRGSWPWVAQAIRLGMAGFFAVGLLYFGSDAVYLTPELRANAPWVPLLQGLIVLTLLLRRTAWLGAVGIATLYGAAIASYGWFHLLDYPVFLGAAAFITIDSLGRGQYNRQALAVVRVTAGLTLMWGGAEKWLYPWWSDDAMNGELQALRGGLSPAFFMAAAGWVEFCCAYAIISGSVGTQIAAWVLLVPFVGAVPLFGALDAVGHAPIIIVLLVLGLTRTTLPPWAQGAAGAAVMRRGLSCALAALAWVGAYWLLQALAYRPGAMGVEDLAVALLLIMPLALWWLPRLVPAFAASMSAASAMVPNKFRRRSRAA